MQIWASWVWALNWSSLWTQQNIQGSWTHPAANTGSLGRCLQLINMSETLNGEVLLVVFSKVKRKFPFNCKLQMGSLHPQTLLLPVFGSEQTVQLHVTSHHPKAPCEAKKLPCQWLSPTILLTKCFNSSKDDVQKKAVVIYLLMVNSLERSARSLTCILVHTLQPWQEMLGRNCCPLEVVSYLRDCYVKALVQEYLQKSYPGCGSSFLAYPRLIYLLSLKIVCGEGMGGVA